MSSPSLTGAPADLAPRAGAPVFKSVARPLAAASALLLCVAACVASAAAGGPSFGWDRAHYHLYAGWQWVNDALGRGFLPAGGQTYLNPLAYVPGYLMWIGGWSELAIASITAAVQALSVWAIWLIARDRIGGHALAAGAALLAFLTPVFQSQLGTSHIDATTSIGVLLGVWACLRAADAQRHAIAWAALGGVAMGLATALKLSNAPAAVAAPLLFAWVGLGLPATMRLRRFATALAAYGGAATAGFALGLGAWGLRLHREHGNPFFPILDRVFNPPVAAVADLASGPAAVVALTPLQTVLEVLRASSGRFVPDSLGELLTLPLRIADPRLPTNYAYVEWQAPDPRLAVLLGLLAVVAAVAAIGWVRGARGVAADGSARRIRAIDPPLLAFCGAWAALWIVSSTNGRYAIGLLMLLSVPILQAARAVLRSVRARVYGMAVLFGLQAWYVLQVEGGNDVTRALPWPDATLQADLPDSLRERPWLHLTMAQQSWSFLMPLLHPDSSFANLQAACRGDACPAAMKVARLAHVFDGWAGRTRALLVVVELQDGAPRLGTDLVARTDAELAEFRLRLDVPACEFFTVRPNPSGELLVARSAAGRELRPSEWLASCPLVTAEPEALRRIEAEVSRHDALFEAIERACASRLGPGQRRTRWLAADVWVRDYWNHDARVWLSTERVAVLGLRREWIELGSMAALQATGLAACEAPAGARDAR